MQSLRSILEKVFPSKNNIGIKYQAIGTNLFRGADEVPQSSDTETLTMQELIHQQQSRHLDRIFHKAVAGFKSESQEAMDLFYSSSEKKGIVPEPSFVTVVDKTLYLCDRLLTEA